MGGLFEVWGNVEAHALLCKNDAGIKQLNAAVLLFCIYVFLWLKNAEITPTY